MKCIYLIRHCRPDIPLNKQIYLGLSDIALSDAGRRQARDLQNYFQEKDIKITDIFSSNLKRSIETAEIIGNGKIMVKTDKDLRELSSGEWEGLSFDEAKARDPELYMKRGERPDLYPPPGGESYSHGGERFKKAMLSAAEEAKGDFAVIGHATVNRIFLCNILGQELSKVFTIAQPYGCMNIIHYKNGEFTARKWSIMPKTAPDAEDCRLLFMLHNTPQEVLHHCEAVRDKAVELCKGLIAKGYSLDLDLVQAAACLHDIARVYNDHARLGGKWLRNEGYYAIADIITDHHDISDEDASVITEKSLVYLADKLILGQEEVTLAERFDESLKKCNTMEEKRAHLTRYSRAKKIDANVRQAMGRR